MGINLEDTFLGDQKAGKQIHRVCFNIKVLFQQKSMDNSHYILPQKTKQATNNILNWIPFEIEPYGVMLLLCQDLLFMWLRWHCESLFLLA